MVVPPSQPGDNLTRHAVDQPRSGSMSPERPPVSPITPVPAFARLAATDAQERAIPPPAFAAPPATYISRPPSVPVSESDNPDAMALRAAISLLQVQREKSRRDLRTLERLRERALAEPDLFLRELNAGTLRGDGQGGDLLGPTLEDALKDLEPDGAHGTAGSGGREIRDSQDENQQISSGPPSPPPTAPASRFPQFPTPQNIVRCPPIEWAKYHVVGESLNKLHDEQVRRPTAGDLTRDVGSRPPVHVVASPYSPFSDKLAGPHTSQTRKGSSKPS